MVQSQGLGRGELLKIGEVAARANVSVDTVRLYERRGLLPAAERTASGYRTFPPSTVSRIQITRQLRELGMTLEEIGAAFRGAGHAESCTAESWRLELVRSRLDTQIAHLQAIRKRLHTVIASCQACDCPITAP